MRAHPFWRSSLGRITCAGLDHRPGLVLGIRAGIGLWWTCRRCGAEDVR